MCIHVKSWSVSASLSPTRGCVTGSVVAAAGSVPDCRRKTPVLSQICLLSCAACTHAIHTLLQRSRNTYTIAAVAQYIHYCSTHLRCGDGGYHGGGGGGYCCGDGIGCGGDVAVLVVMVAVMVCLCVCGSQSQSHIHLPSPHWSCTHIQGLGFKNGAM